MRINLVLNIFSNRNDCNLPSVRISKMTATLLSTLDGFAYEPKPTVSKEMEGSYSHEVSTGHLSSKKEELCHDS